MPTANSTVRLYQELASLCGRQGQPQMHDRFLVLAADAALTAGRTEEAERLRLRLLQHNPHHLLKPYTSFAEAMRAADVQSYVAALRRNHPQPASEQLLQSLRKGDEAEGDGLNLPPEDDLNYTADMRGLGEPESLKVFRGHDSADDIAPAEHVPKPQLAEPPKPAVPWTAPPPKFNQKRPTDLPDEDAPALPPTLPAPRAAPAPPPVAKPVPAPIPKPLAQRRPAQTALKDVYGLAPEPASERGNAAEGEEGPFGSWLTWGLLLTLAVLGAALATYTVARPFLQLP